LAYIIGNYYYYFGFTYPKPFALWVSDLYGTANAEDIADLEIILNFIVSFLAVSIFTFIFLVIKKKLNRVRADN